MQQQEEKCVEAGNTEQKEKLFNLANENCSDQFGNYVIQYVVGVNVEIINKFIVTIIMKNLVPLCKEKYASNVIEKFIFNKSSYSKAVIDAIISDKGILHDLIVDNYGNDIIQRILTIIVGDARMKAITMIVQWYDEIKVLPFGPRLIAKLSEKYGEFNMLVGNKYNTMNIVNNNSSSNIGNVNLIQMNNYMFTPQTVEMYMNMMKQQNMYNQYGYGNYGNMYQQQQYPMQYGYMKPKGKSNHYG